MGGWTPRPAARSTWPGSAATGRTSLRVAASIYTGSVRAYDIVRALQRDGHPTPLGEAIASYGRIFKSFHVLAIIDDESYRRDIKGIRNLQEGRHGLAGKIFHGRKGQIWERYHAGIEDQLGALGLVLNCVTLEHHLHERRPGPAPPPGLPRPRRGRRPAVPARRQAHQHLSGHVADLLCGWSSGFCCPVGAGDATTRAAVAR